MLASLVLLAASKPPVFEWPASYSFRGTWKVPYTNLSNTLIVSHEPHRQYTSEANGLLRQWNTGPEEHFHRKTVAAYNKTICYGYGPDRTWDIEMTKFLPDPTGYRQIEGLHAYNGRLCRLYEKTEATGKTQTWRMYVDNITSDPVAYVAQAISLYGSHYDLYVLEIKEFSRTPLSGVWVLPSVCDGPIEDDPYPGSQYDLFFPKDDVAIAKNAMEMSRKGKNHAVKYQHMDVSRLRETILARKTAPKPSNFIDDVCKAYHYTGAFDPMPENFSWRDQGKVGPPRDQVACGSCWAFGTAEVLEGAFTNLNGQIREVSVNQIMDCTWEAGNFGCQGGEVGPALSSYMLHNRTIAWEKDYPYLGVSGMCNPRIENPAGVVKDCWHVDRNRNAVKEALMKFGPLAISINVIEDMLFYTDGVFDNEACTGTDSEMIHIVLLTGWKVIDGKEAWEVKNSWSTYWGNEGYIYIQSEEQEWNCGVTTRAVAVEVAEIK